MHRRFTSFAAHVLVACLPVLGLVMAVGAGTASAARSPVNARAAALAALQHLKIGEHDTDHPLPGQSVRVKGCEVQSGNWAGYADTKTSGKYSKVTGSWTRAQGHLRVEHSRWRSSGPGSTVSPAARSSRTAPCIECNGGTPTYFSWWEMFPSNSVQVVSTAVRPGDHITSSVTRSGTKYTLKLTDSTHTAASFSTTQTCAAATCVDSSAEWIAEAPSGSSGIVCRSPTSAAGR